MSIKIENSSVNILWTSIYLIIKNYPHDRGVAFSGLHNFP